MNHLSRIFLIFAAIKTIENTSITLLMSGVKWSKKRSEKGSDGDVTLSLDAGERTDVPFTPPSLPF